MKTRKRCMTIFLSLALFLTMILAPAVSADSASADAAAANTVTTAESTEGITASEEALAAKVNVTTFSSNSLQIDGDAWTLKGCASYSSGIITLTEAKTQQYAVVSKDVPLDTRDGFTLSFDYYVGDNVDDPREGFQLIFSNKEPTTNSGTYSAMGYNDYYNSGTYFYGIEFDSHYDNKVNDGEHVAAVYANGSITKTHLKTVDYTISDSTWHSATVTYDGDGTVKVWIDSELILTCTSFNVPDLCYFGFSAGTYLYAFGYQAHKVKNIDLDCDDACLVTYNANGGNSKTSQYVLSGSSSLGETTRTGYKFLGWYTQKSGGTKVTSVNKNTTVYAHWAVNSYKVTFKAAGGKTSKKSKTVTYSKKYKKLPKATRKGYTFKGWYTKKSGGTKVTAKTTVTTAANHKLYAHWKAKTYKVTFNANGGSVSKTSKKAKYNSKIGSLPTPTRSSYTFKGWYTKKSGGKKVTSSTKMKGNITLYAHWEKKSTSSGTTSGSSSSGSSSSGSSSSDSSSSSSSGSSSSLSCVMCGGTGLCSNCGGTGYTYSYAMDNNRLNCYKCNASGKCTYCGGTGLR